MRIFTIVICALALAACGSPSDSLRFTAPKKFGNTKIVMGMAQVWQTQDKKEVLTLLKLPFSADPKKALQSSTFNDAKLEKQEQIKICGNQAATHFTLTKASERQSIDAIMAPMNGVTYLAMYGYPENGKPDSQAESAIRNLCPK